MLIRLTYNSGHVEVKFPLYLHGGKHYSTVQIVNPQYTFNVYHAIHLYRQPYKNASAETVSMDLKSELKKVFTGQVCIYTKVFSSLDQVTMEESSKLKTAFVIWASTNTGACLSVSTNAPATFQRLMGKVFDGRDWDFVFVYLEDILIALQTIEEHLDHLQKVFRRQRESGLRLKPTKCTFATKKIEYLGHTLTPEGVKPNEKGVQ